MLGFIGYKIGMISYFDHEKNLLPVTLIYIKLNYIINYDLISFLKIISNYKKNYFFKLNQFYFNLYYIGDFLNLNNFYINQYINVSGVTIGKGFAGTIKKNNFKSNNFSHGNSKAHRKPGSIGMCQDPGRVFLGKKLPGHLGFKKKTIKNLKILEIDFINNILFLKGSIPGFINNYIYIF